jgi:4-methylaminobutanoate oxidase (formaldehyde-forming)
MPSESADLPSHAEIVIVGGGVLGASTAFHLSRLGREVLLIDRGPLGAETSSQGAGFLCSVRPSLASARLVHYSTTFYSRFEAETGYRVDLHMTGGVRVALSQAWLDELFAEADTSGEAGVASRRLTRDDVQALIPPLRTGGILGGTFVPLEGYVTATRDVAIGLARGAARGGACVRTHVALEQLRTLPGGEIELETSAGRVLGGKLVLAANAGMWPLARRIGQLYPSFPLLHECAVYALPADIPADMPTLRIGERDLYIRHEAGGLMIGGVGNDPSGPPTDAPEELFRLGRTDVEPGEVAAARRRAAAFFPGMAEAICFREQRGLAMVAPDLEPVAGEWAPNLYVVSADLRGVQSAPGLGLLMAQLVATGQCEFDHRPYDPKRFGTIDGPESMREAARRGLRPRWSTQ